MMCFSLFSELPLSVDRHALAGVLWVAKDDGTTTHEALKEINKTAVYPSSTFNFKCLVT